VTATIIAPLKGRHQTQPSHCPASLGVIEDIEREAREADRPELDETDTAHFAQELTQLLAAPLVPVAGPACCGGLMTETNPGCWKCPTCGLTLTPFHLTAPAAEIRCCGRPLRYDAKTGQWYCPTCYASDQSSGYVPQHRSQADEALGQVRAPRATAGTGTLNTLAVLTAPLAASAAGEYQCANCGARFYSEKPFQLCTGCGGG
jgi:hypothetical protein